ncbi:MAG: hypothetical protein WD534_08685 [Phycisphaeraceae bacterium]
MHTWRPEADNLLRGRPVQARHGEARRLLHLLQLLVMFGIVYGLVMGSFGGVAGERLWQPIYSGLKVPLLLLVSFGISLPSFFVLNSLFGLRDDFAQVLHALVAAQAGLTLVLAAVAPFTVVWYLSVGDYNMAILFNAGMFAVATLAGQWMLRRSYRPLILRQPRHRLMLRAWLVIYAFVGIQMGWVLRPFIGSPDAPTRFFRSEAWGNAYVEVGQIVLRAFGGG